MGGFIWPTGHSTNHLPNGRLHVTYSTQYKSFTHVKLHLAYSTQHKPLNKWETSFGLQQHKPFNKWEASFDLQFTTQIIYPLGGFIWPTVYNTNNLTNGWLHLPDSTQHKSFTHGRLNLAYSTHHQPFKKWKLHLAYNTQHKPFNKWEDSSGLQYTTQII